MAAILSTAAKGILAKLGGKAIGAIGKAVGIVKKNPIAAAGTIATAAQVAVAVKGTGTSIVPQLPGFAGGGMPPMGPGGPPTMYSPGGTPLGGVPGIPVSVTGPVEMVARPRAPKGYSVIEVAPGQYIAMLTKVAEAMGLKKRPRKTTRISSRDIQGAQKVNRFITQFSVNRVPKTKLKKKARR